MIFSSIMRGYCEVYVIYIIMRGYCKVYVIYIIMSIIKYSVNECINR